MLPDVRRRDLQLWLARNFSSGIIRFAFLVDFDLLWLARNFSSGIIEVEFQLLDFRLWLARNFSSGIIGGV